MFQNVLSSFMIGVLLALSIFSFSFVNKLSGLRTKNSLNYPPFSKQVLAETITIPSQTENISKDKQTSISKLTAGFFPYWNLDNIDNLDFSALGTIYYFGLDLNEDGSFNRNDPGFPRLSSKSFEKLKQKAKEHNIRLGVTLINLDQDSIAKNINHPQRRQTIINNTINIMREEGFVDVNIDLEYIASYDEGLRKNYTIFVRDLSRQVKAVFPDAKISLDVFADSVAKNRVFDFHAMDPYLDQIIIMGYDFHRINSIKAGPVAPIFGKEKYEYDIITSIKDFTEIIDSAKIILGVPFYGYEWPVEKPIKEAFVINSIRPAEIASYNRATKLAQENNLSVNFDDESKSAWFSYFDKPSNTWRQVWFENERSMSTKLDLINQAHLGGIAIFALGYEGSNSNPLWSVIKDKLPN